MQQSTKQIVTIKKTVATIQVALNLAVSRVFGQKDGAAVEVLGTSQAVLWVTIEAIPVHINSSFVLIMENLIQDQSIQTRSVANLSPITPNSRRDRSKKETPACSIQDILR